MSNQTEDTMVAFADDVADKLLECARMFYQLSLPDNQRICAEASKLISQQARELKQARTKPEPFYGFY